LKAEVRIFTPSLKVAFQHSLSGVVSVSYVLQKLQWNPISKFGNFTTISFPDLKLFKAYIINTTGNRVEVTAIPFKITWLGVCKPAFRWERGI
jgi:hypothetical protein